MNTNPINLAIRFLLEMVILVTFGLWGWHLFIGWEKYIAALVFPTMAAVLWGVFRIPNDPGSAPIKTPGIIRLLIEGGLFGLSIWILYSMNYIRLSYAMTIIVVLHYLVSYDRTWAMLRNRPYKGFVK